MKAPDEAIWLRPHHVERYFYGWMGLDLASHLRSCKDDGKRTYDEATIRHIQTIHHRLFLHNAPFVITPGVDDVCQGCNAILKDKDRILTDFELYDREHPGLSMVQPEFDCTFDKDNPAYKGLSWSGFQKVFGIDFKSSFGISLDKPSTYVPLKVYRPSEVIMAGIEGLLKLIAEEESLPDCLQIDNAVLNCEYKLMALEKAYENLRGAR